MSTDKAREHLGKYGLTDKIDLFEARELAGKASDTDTGIGTLSEKYIHRTLKFHYEPDEAFHEIEYLGSVADIMNGDGIIEIQTRAFEKLSSKLKKFLPDKRVTVVCPLPYHKYIVTVGEGDQKRKKSPRQKGLSDAAIELYKIKEYIGNDNLSVALVFLETVQERFAVLGGAKVRYKKGLHYPVAITEELVLKSREDYKVFLPDSLPESFLSKDYYKAICSRARFSYYALKLCEYLGFIKKTGKKGNAYIYTRVN